MMRFLLLSLLLLSVSIANARDGVPSCMEIGAQAGMTLSRVRFNPSVQQAFLPGLIMGARWKYVEERHFGLIAELNLSQHGWKERYDADEGDFSYTRRFTYVEIPMMTHVFFGSDRVRGFFNAGPQVGFMIGERTTANFDVESIPSDYPADRRVEQLTLPVKSKVDYGIVAGVGVELNVARRHAVVLEGRFYYGLRDVFANHNTDAFAASSTLAIAVTLGYSFALTH